MITVGTENQSNREVWLEKTLKQIPSGSRILDAGAGEQPYKKYCSHLQYVSQDFARYNGKGNGAGLQMRKWDQTKLDIVSDIIAIPEPDESFDAIMSVEVFEHLPNPLAALKEFYRLLRKGGQLILTAPFCSLTHLAPYHFYTGFNRYFYEHHLPVYGFEIVEFQVNGNFFEYLAQELRRIPAVSARYTKAKAPNILERLALGIVLRILGRFSAQDKGSPELLCFGYQVRAVKR